MANNKQIPEIRFSGFTDAWEQRKLGDVIEKLTGGTSITPDDYQEEGVRTLPKGAVNSNGVADLSGCKYVSKEFFERHISSMVSTNDLVTSLRDLVPSAPNMGRIVCIIAENEDFLMPQGVYKIQLNDKIDKNFVIAYSNNDRYRKIISSEKNGSTQVHMRNGEFLNIDISIPDFSEQQQIGAFFKNLDDLITLHQRECDKLMITKKSMLEKMFPKNNEVVPEIRFSGFTDAWEQRKLIDVVDFLDTQRKPLEEGKRKKGNYPYYGASGIVDYVADYLFDEELILLSEDGANITNRSFPVCFLASGKYWVNNHAHVLRVKPGNDNNFISDSMEKKEFAQFNTGTTMPKLNQEVCKNIPLICPNFEEQRQIGAFFKNLDDLITLHQRELEKLNNIKKSMLEKMFV
jgi:type I restriction enzyme S subunit